MDRGLDNDLYPDYYSAWIEQTFSILVPRDPKEKERTGKGAKGKCKALPTTVYGEIEFDGQEPGKFSKQYVRISDDSDASKVAELLCHCWGLKLPRFIISVTGGATSFELPPRLDDMIKDGLCNAATSSNTWIITGGTNTGVMKYVGQAIAKVKDKPTGPVIAIAPWAVLNGKETLTGARGEEPDENKGEDWIRGGCAKYPDPNSFKGSEFRSLDKNHTHFILVDNGRNGLNEFGGEIVMRAKIEEKLTSTTSTGTFDIEYPIATVIVAIQGGPGTVNTCYEAIKRNVPVVIVNGSGQAADAIAYAYFMRHEPAKHNCSLKGLTEIVARFCRPDLVQELTETVLNCVLVKEQLTIFEVDFYGRHDQPLDVAILDAVFKWDEYLLETGGNEWLKTFEGEKQSFKDDAEKRKHDQQKKACLKAKVEKRKARNLELALTWGRPDIGIRETAKFRILQNFVKRMAEKDSITLSKSHMLKWALTHNRPEFVKLFLETMDIEDVSGFLQHTSQVYPPPLSVLIHGKRKKVSRQVTEAMTSSKVWHKMKEIPEPSGTFKGTRPAHINRAMQKAILECFYHANLQAIGKPAHEAASLRELIQMHEDHFSIKQAHTLSWHLMDNFHTFFISYVLGNGMMISKQPEEGEPHATASVTTEDAYHLCSMARLTWIHRMIDDGWNYAQTYSESQKTSPLLKPLTLSLEKIKKDTADLTLPELNTATQDERSVRVVFRFLKILLHQYHIVLWKPTVVESLYVWSTAVTPARLPFAQQINCVLPEGAPYEDHIRKMLNTAVGNGACYDTLSELSPYFSLIIWAVVAGYSELALYFWELLPASSITTALVANRVITHVIDSYEDMPPEKRRSYEKLSEDILSRSKDVLDKLETTNSSLAEEILLAPDRHGGYLEPRLLAFICADIKLVAKPAFSRVGTRLWFGDLDPGNSWFKIVLGAIFFPYVLLAATLDKRNGTPAKTKGWKAFMNAFSIRTILYPDPYKERAVEHTEDIDLDDPEGLRWKEALSRRPTNVASKLRKDKHIGRLHAFFTAPVTKFTIQTLSFLALVITYSYSAMVPTRSLSQSELLDTDIVVIIVFLWMITLMVEEFLQAKDLGIKDWWASVWNKWDLCIIVLYLLAFVLRWSTVQRHLGWSRYIYSFVAIALWLRLARNYAVNMDLGPKLIMIEKMIGDIIVFMALMLLVFLGYAVALYSILYEERGWDEYTYVDLTFQPYFQIYGELFLEDMLANTNCTNSNFTDCNGDSGWVAAPLLAIYILVANILLVNLLIAMMSKRYEEVEENATELWAYQNMEIVEEIKNTWTAVPMPLSLIRRTFQLFYWLGHKAATLRKVHPLCAQVDPELRATERDAGRIRNLIVHPVMEYLESRKEKPDATAELKRTLDALLERFQDSQVNPQSSA